MREQTHQAARAHCSFRWPGASRLGLLASRPYPALSPTWKKYCTKAAKMSPYGPEGSPDTASPDRVASHCSSAEMPVLAAAKAPNLLLPDSLSSARGAVSAGSCVKRRPVCIPRRA